MSDNPSSRKIGARLAQIRTLERECIAIFIEHPTCLETEMEKEELIALAINHIEAKVNRSNSSHASYSNSSAIRLTIAIQEFEEASNNYAKKQYAKSVIQKLLEMSEAELRLVPAEAKATALSIAYTYFVGM